MILTLLATLALGAPQMVQGPGGDASGPGPLDRSAGWQSLLGGDLGLGWDFAAAPGWSREDGVLHRHAGGGDLVHSAVLTDFELAFDWRVSRGGNSGVKYRVRNRLGPEYQVLDDARHPDGKRARHSAAALYDLLPAKGKTLRPTFEFNRALVRAVGPRLEHWLNGVRVLDVDLETAAFGAALAKSKFRAVADFGREPGTLLLQDHGDEVAYRRLWLRDLSALAEKRSPLFDGETLAGWRALGDAIYEVDEDSILGRIGGGGQSFLVTEQSFGDFILEVELKPELPGNSGIQVRSHQRESGRLFGYQIEIDSSKRAWSGGLYDEARRGWLDDLKDNPAGRDAFRTGEWNEYRIECVGPWIRAWVNGVPTADYLDGADLEGVFGLQVHSGNNTRIRWRNLRLTDLGGYAWTPADAHIQSTAESQPTSLVFEKPLVGLRMTVEGGIDTVWINGVAVPVRSDLDTTTLEFLTNGRRSAVTQGDRRRVLPAPLDLESVQLSCEGHGPGRLSVTEILTRL